MTAPDAPEKKAVRTVAELMALAARTAPKAKGQDNIVVKVLDEAERRKVVEKMREIGEKESIPFFLRDAENLEAAEAILLVGTRLAKMGIPHCGFCGFPDCASNTTGVCAFNAGDLGIACGSAAAVAALHHVDTRMMFTVGRSALEAAVMEDDVAIAYGFPLSATGKNPFFDRG